MPITKTLTDTQKFYAMFRMRVAIERAIVAKTAAEKGQAAGWASAWGTVAGIPGASRTWR